MAGQQTVRGQPVPDAEHTIGQSGGDGLAAGGPRRRQQSQCLGGLFPSDAGPARGTKSDDGDRAEAGEDGDGVPRSDVLAPKAMTATAQKLARLVSSMWR